MNVKTIAVVKQEGTPERLRKTPAYGKGAVSWACSHERCGHCTKLTCSCECHRVRTGGKEVEGGA